MKSMNSFEHAKDEEAQNEQQDAKVKNKSPWFTRFIAWLALFFTIVGIAAGYKNWLHIHKKAKANEVTIQEMQTQQAAYANSADMQALSERVNGQVSEVQKQTDQRLRDMQRLSQETEKYKHSMEAQIADITRLQGQLQMNAQTATSKDWLIADTEYLLRMAGRQLHFNHDKHSALALLQAADENLAQLGEAHYLPVRQQLSKDMITLESWQAVDVTSILQKISALGIKIQPLPASGVDHSEGEAISFLTIDEAAESDREKFVNNLKQQLNDAIVIRKYSKPLKVAMDADSRLQLYRLLQLRLETLKQLTLKGLDAEYHQQIQLIRTTLQDYYPESLAKPLLAMLDQLDEQNLSPALPQIHGAYKQLLLAQQSSQSMPEKAYQVQTGVKAIDEAEDKEEQQQNEDNASADVEPDVTDKQE